MKREEIKALLESDKSIDEKIIGIMDANGADINFYKTEMSKSNDKYTELKAQFDSQASEFTALKERTKNYDEISKGYQDLLKEKENTGRLDILKGLNCKHPDLLVDKVDWDKYNNEAKEFDADYLKDFKEKYTDLFQPSETLYKPKVSTNPTGSYTGLDPKKMTKEELQKL